MAPHKEKFCCEMRRHFLIGIIGKRKDSEAPTDMADFVVAWEPQIVIKIKYCPFCGTDVGNDDTLRVVTSFN